MNRALTIIIISLLCGGCIALPIPHLETTTPKVSGKIIFLPPPKKLPKINYELRVEDYLHSGEIIPDKNGNYRIHEREKTFYWYFIPLAPMDIYWKGHINIKIEGWLAYSKDLGPYPRDINQRHLNDIKTGVLIVRLKQKNMTKTEKQ